MKQGMSGHPVIELMTVGYEGMAPSAFFELLRRCKVETLVDVRELPISRKAGFAKSRSVSACRDPFHTSR